MALDRIVKFVLSNWGFCAFVITLGIALWANLKYGVGYFESQRTISLTKKSSEYYRQLGDKLILYGEFAAAQDAYDKALKIHPSNIEATRGRLKIQALEPLEGQRFVIPQLAELRIESPKELLKRDEKRGVSAFFGLSKPMVDGNEDYFVDYLEGTLSEMQQDATKANASYRRSFEKNPKFIQGYLALAVLDYQRHDYDAVIATLEAAQEQDPNSASVLNALGACSMIRGDFAKARELFERAQNISPDLSTIWNMGEANRYLGEAASAAAWDELALHLLSDGQNERERIVASDINFGFMPERAGAQAPPHSMQVSTTKEKQMVVRYALSLDYALKQDFVRADEAFDQAQALDPTRTCSSLVENRILSIEHFSGLTLPGATLTWMEGKRDRLAATR